MKKLLFGLLLVSCQFAWSQVKETKIKYDGKEQHGIIAEIPHAPDVVTKAIKDKMAEKGFKGSSTKGWTIYKGVKLKSIGDETVDLYTKVESKSKKEKDVSELQVLISKGYDNFVESGSVHLTNTRDFIDEIAPVAEAMSLELEIKSQEDAVKKCQKKLDDLVSDSISLEKKKRKLEEDLATTTKKQAEQTNEISRQQTILEQLRSKRKK